MSEILTLAERFKQKQNEQAQSIESELTKDMQTLKSSTRKSLKESENIITKDITESRHRITEHTTKNEGLIKTQVTKSGQSIITHSQETESQVIQMLSSLRTNLKKLSKNWWLIVTVILVTFALGMLVGVILTKLISKPYQPTYQYYYDSKTKLTYLVPLEN